MRQTLIKTPQGGRRMARYKHHDYSLGKFVPTSFEKQILPGTFALTLDNYVRMPDRIRPVARNAFQERVTIEKE
jgi:hypothetical protein